MNLRECVRVISGISLVKDRICRIIKSMRKAMHANERKQIGLWLGVLLSALSSSIYIIGNE